MVKSQNVDNVDPATTVITTMRERGISSLPRNYELVYQFLNTSNAVLIKEFAALGQRPTQLQLDEIGKKFLPHHHASNAVELNRERISDEMKGMIRLFKQDQSTLQKYSSVLGETTSRISETSAASGDIMDDLVDVLSSATGATMEKSQAIVRQMVVRAKEMSRLKSELEEYKRLATIDPITRLSNRRAFDERLAAIYEDKQSAMYHALLVADIDHFKAFNDNYGHQVGDRVLSVTAVIMRTTLGKDVFVARTGGEEFAVILDETSLASARDTAEKIRRAIEATPLKNHTDGVDCGRITMTFGLCMAGDASGPEELYQRADTVLYEAKKAGRNQLKVYTPKMKREWNIFKR
ncbi:GGDEF domain-containing protein [Hoeflea sp. AS60]|uniref:GGDEF domain-containing protein n=1 Tax=Hoeflea sp. AS60 TaxID=3135780 RepID=UPI00317AC136